MPGPKFRTPHFCFGGCRRRAKASDTDGSSESTAASIGFDGRVHTTEADRRPPVRRVLANFTAVAQIALLAIALLAKLDAVGSISTTNYVNSMLVIGGFAIAGCPNWATTWRAGEVRNAWRKWRGVDCRTALISLVTVASTIVGDAKASPSILPELSLCCWQWLGRCLGLDDRRSGKPPNYYSMRLGLRRHRQRCSLSAGKT